MFVSWNGATEVVDWRLEMWDGSDMKEMRSDLFDLVFMVGLKTEIELLRETRGVYFRAVFLDRQDSSLAATVILSKEVGKSFFEYILNLPSNELSFRVVISILMIGFLYS